MTATDPSPRSVLPETDSMVAFAALADAAKDWKPVSGWTHNFYRYPARFSPRFAAAAVTHFSVPGELVADPYMGGGTAFVEAIVAGRLAVGNDLNALAAFIATVKTTRLMAGESEAIRLWALETVPRLNYRVPIDELTAFIHPTKTKNLSLARARFIKKVIAAALASIDELPSQNAKSFTRCVLLRASQWALDGRRRHTSLPDFRKKLSGLASEMLVSVEAFATSAEEAGGQGIVLNMDAAHFDQAPFFQDPKNRVALVVTSPPYPGVHVLYHRWQVDGRRETPAPYWIAGCNDGQGASFYNFGDRRQGAADSYFRNSLLTLQAIRRVMKDGGHMVQMVAFNRPEEQLPRYLENMRSAGFSEVLVGSPDRIWRQVPNRKWHATLKGKTHSSSEVVLVHRAI